ncbi:molybdenum cofactor guanylyltransferase [Sporolactobacillus sp. THM7-4]|nr:molybdenum cofactor guanylyltransferase [Sporolactobacillus sp. THM7-4]
MLVNQRQITGIILAGGRSRRFGAPKAMAFWRGCRLIDYSIRALQPVLHELIIVSHLPQLHQLKNVRVITDEQAHEGQGPLSGIRSAMECVNTPWVFVLPCDMPLFTAKDARKLIQRVGEEPLPEAIVPLIYGRAQPLCALYHHPEVKEKIDRQLAAGKKSMMDLLKQCNVKYVTETALSIDPAAFLNVNTRDDYHHLLQLNKDQSLTDQ